MDEFLQIPYQLSSNNNESYFICQSFGQSQNNFENNAFQVCGHSVGA